MVKMITKKTKLSQRRATTSSISCKGHLYQLGELSIGSNIRTCKIEDCNEKYYAKGLCRKHWNKQYKQERKEEIKKYYQDNKEKRKQYYLDNKKHIIEHHKQYYRDHKEQAKQYQQNNKETIAIKKKQYRQNHRKEIARHAKQYRKTPVGKASMKASWHNRRILEKGLTIAIVQSVYEDNIKKHGILICCLCNKVVEFVDSSLEHLTPLVRGGTNDYENLGIAHKSCNSKKGTMTLDEWQNRSYSKGLKEIKKLKKKVWQMQCKIENLQKKTMTLEEWLCKN